jgi:uncharacterized membrane protein
MDWTVVFPFPLPEMLQVALVTALDLAVSLAIFAGCLLAERSLSVARFTRAAWLMAGLLGAFETILVFVGFALSKALIVGPLRLLGISVVLVTAIWFTRVSTRRTA